MTFADRILQFNNSLSIKEQLPDGVEVMNPFKNPDTMEACTTFYKKYYDDDNPRRIIFGINPGRFGAGVTGIPFTDPDHLEKVCGIPNSFDKKKELSAQFIYELIKYMGGAEHFYKHYFIGAVSPLGFVKEGKNYNYYDSKILQNTLKPFIIKTMVEQIGLGIQCKKCYCLGQGKNFEYLKMLNMEVNLFDEIVPLPHPRWIMQYKRRQKEQYLSYFSEKLSR